MTKKTRKKLPIKFAWWLGGFATAMTVMLLGMIWGAGVVYSELPDPARLGPDFKPVDVIVCLTGGKGRIRHSIELFEKGYGNLLYISGIDPQVQITEIMKELKRAGPINETNIILENVATNTIENAEQVAMFIRQRGLKSMLLVTSSYHVRRSSFIFRRLLPQDVQIETTWLEVEPFDQKAWWKSWKGIVVTVTEFLKFFYAYIRLPA